MSLIEGDKIIGGVPNGQKTVGVHASLVARSGNRHGRKCSRLEQLRYLLLQYARQAPLARLRPRGDDLRPEWDLNIEQIRSGDGWIAGLTAGVFDVTGHERKPRPPITDLTFSIEGDPQPIVAQIVGAPNAANGIKAFLEANSAAQLLTAFSDDSHLITINLKHSEGSTEVLQIRPWHDWSKFSGGKNSLLNDCLRGYTRPPDLQRPVP